MTPLIISYAVICVLIAGIVRGFSGFGFSLLTITSISLVLKPVEVIPAIFMLEVAASLRLLISAWADVHWRSLVPLLIGCVAGTPMGIYLLQHAPEAPMTMALGLFALVSTGLLALGFTLKKEPGKIFSGVVGFASGLFNGAFGIGGPPVVLFYVASPARQAEARASLIAFFLATDLMGLGFLARSHLIGMSSLWLAAIFLPALLVGLWVGAHGFSRVDQGQARKLILGLLGILSVITIGKGLVLLFGR